MTTPLLELHDVVAGYGPITVLNGLSLPVAPQEKLAHHRPQRRRQDDHAAPR